VPRPIIFDQIAEQIRRDIAPYPDGRVVPSVRNLVRRYGVSYDTVRKALGVLVDQGEIASHGRGRSYVRRRKGLQDTYCKPYPALALVSLFELSFRQSGYMSALISSFVSSLIHRIGVWVPPVDGSLQLKPVPGGAEIGPPSFRCSALAFRSGAPRELLQSLVNSGAVVMTLDHLSDLEQVDSVATDTAGEAEAAVEYLSSLEHRHIAFIASRWPKAPPHWPDRIDPDSHSFDQALLQSKQRAGLCADPAYHVTCDMGYRQVDAAAWSAINQLWRLSPPPTALLCFVPVVAQQALLALAKRDLYCPRDVSILTRGHPAHSDVRFTIFQSDPERIGASAAAHLITRLTQPSCPASQLLFASSLAEGQTTGPARLDG
jgi:hypothetical protein